MPYSFTYFKSEVKEWFEENIPTSSRILDVGPGLGTYSDLLRSSGYRMDAVEIFEPYIEKYGLRAKYDNVYCKDIIEFDFGQYDFIILGDILEHIPAVQARVLIQTIVLNKQECLVAIPYEMEQGEHEGNIHETHHQPDLTHDVMKERYPDLTELYSNEYYGYYTYTRIKEDKMYVLYANAAYHSTVCMAVDSIRKFSNIPITVYMLDSNKEVPGANVVKWKCDINTIERKEYLDRANPSIYKLLIQRPLIVKHTLQNFAKTVCYIDADSIATQHVDSIFDMYATKSWYPYFTEGIYDYLHNNGRGGADSRDDLSTTLEHPACELFNVDQYVRNRYVQTGYFVAGQHTILFLDEWSWMCNYPQVLKNPQYYAPYHEETIVNVLLWKHKFFDSLPYIYTNASLDKLDRVFNEDNWGKHVESWFRLPDSEDQLFFLHGEKDPVEMSKIMSKLPSKMSKPLKIMYLAPHLSTGGMPAFLLKTIETLKDDVEIYVVEYTCNSMDFVVQRNAIINIVGDNFKTLYEDKTELFDVIDKWNPDIIHIHEPSERLDSNIISKLYNNNRSYRIVETCHDISFKPDEEKIYHPDYYAYCTPYHVETFGNMPSLHSVIEFPIDNKRLSNKDVYNAKQYLGMDPNKKHVVNVGLWTSGKNQGEMLELARQMPDVEFHFIGNQAANFEDYWKALMENVPSNATIWGERNDADKFIDAADVFMFNSVWECNPLVLREAISKGKKIIARDLPQYKNMFTRYIVNLDPRKLKNQLTDLLIDKTTYNIIENNTTENFRNKLMSLYKVCKEFDIMKNDIKDYKITQNFVGQPFLEITGTSNSNFHVEFYDAKQLVHRDTIRCNHWIKLNREYYTQWRTVVYKDGEKVYDKLLDLERKRVYISFESSSLGDTIAWMPYVLEFQKKHNCKVIVSTFKNFLFESVYSELEFVAPGTIVNNIYAMYKIGLFYNEFKEPIFPNSVPLQQVATNILGLEFIEIIPSVTFTHKKIYSHDYVTIATNSTAQCKFWQKEDWQILINWLNKQGYKVINVSKEKNEFENCIQIEDTSIDNTMSIIYNAKFQVSLSSGLSWMAYALNTYVFMISNFTNKDYEFTKNCTRIVDTSVCHDCWSEHRLDTSDWNWCPRNKNFECHTSINAEIVIQKIKEWL